MGNAFSSFYKSILGKELIKNCTLIALFEEYMKKIQEYKQEIKQDIIDANMNPIIASIISCYMTY